MDTKPGRAKARGARIVESLLGQRKIGSEKSNFWGPQIIRPQLTREPWRDGRDGRAEACEAGVVLEVVDAGCDVPNQRVSGDDLGVGESETAILHGK